MRVGVRTRHASASGGCVSGLFTLGVVGLIGYAVVAFWLIIAAVALSVAVVVLLVVAVARLVRRQKARRAGALD